MHTIQVMLVEADTHEDARAQVSRAFSDGEPRWSDWNEVDDNYNRSYAGRWNEDNLLGSKAELDTLRYSDDPETAEEVIADFIKYRYNEIALLRQRLYDEGKQDILFSYNYDHEQYPTSITDTMPLYYAKKLAELLGGTWLSDSAIYDLENWDTDLTEFRKRLDTKPEKQFLVLVDFHH